MRRRRRMAAISAALSFAGCTPRDDRSTPERMLQTCLKALQQDDRAELRRCYSPNWPLYDTLPKGAGRALAGSTVEVAEQRDGGPDTLFVVPRYRRPDGGVEEDHALWTELRRIDGQWVIQAEHNDLFE